MTGEPAKWFRFEMRLACFSSFCCCVMSNEGRDRGRKRKASRKAALPSVACWGIGGQRMVRPCRRVVDPDLEIAFASVGLVVLCSGEGEGEFLNY